MPHSTPRKTKAQAARPHPLHDMDVFNEMMETYLQDATASPEAARKELIKIGIHTKSGKLSRHYR